MSIILNYIMRIYKEIRFNIDNIDSYFFKGLFFCLFWLLIIILFVIAVLESILHWDYAWKIILAVIAVFALIEFFFFIGKKLSE